MASLPSLLVVAAALSSSASPYTEAFSSPSSPAFASRASNSHALVLSPDRVGAFCTLNSASSTCYHVPSRAKFAWRQSVLLSQSNSDIDEEEVGCSEGSMRAGSGSDSSELMKEVGKEVTTGERIQVISYRLVLTSSALLLTSCAIFGSSFLSGTGIDGSSVVESAEILLPLAAGLSVLLAPMPEGLLKVAATSLGLAAIATSGAAGAFATEDASVMVLDLSRIFGISSLFAVCVREIYYFGLAFKVEAAVVMAVLPLLLREHDAANDSVYPIAAAISALAVGVLAVGKIFEPCREDFVKSNSEFLAGENTE